MILRYRLYNRILTDLGKKRKKMKFNSRVLEEASPVQVQWAVSNSTSPKPTTKPLTHVSH